MSSVRDIVRDILALPIDEQREALLPLYRAAYAAYAQGDWAVNTAAFADEYEFVARGTSRMPGFPDYARGREAYVEMHTHMLGFLDVERVEIDDLRPLGNGRVVALMRFVIRAGDGTIDQHCLDVHDFRADGALIRQTIWMDRAEGLREIGL